MALAVVTMTTNARSCGSLVSAWLVVNGVVWRQPCGRTSAGTVVAGGYGGGLRLTAGAMGERNGRIQRAGAAAAS
jgi:hypothetical protein